MKSKFQHVGLIGKFLQTTANAQPSLSSGTPPEILLSVIECLKAIGCQVALESCTAEMTGLDKRFPSLELVEIGEQCDVAVVIGGDGTMLSAARTLAPTRIPLIGINQGRLGFITDIPLDTVCEVLPKMLRGEYKLSDHAELFARVDNVLDKDYATFGAYFDPEGVSRVVPNPLPDDPDPRTITPAAPRSYSVGVRLKF